MCWPAAEFGAAKRARQRNLVTDPDLALTARHNHFHIDVITLNVYVGTIPASASSISEPAASPRLAAGSRGERLLDLGEQAVEFDRLRVEFVAAARQRLLAVARHRMRGQRDDRDAASRRVGL